MQFPSPPFKKNYSNSNQHHWNYRAIITDNSQLNIDDKDDPPITNVENKTENIISIDSSKEESIGTVTTYKLIVT